MHLQLFRLCVRGVRLLRCGCALSRPVKTVPEENAPAAKDGTPMGSLVICLIGALVFYILSIGPVERLASEGKIPQSAVRKIYAPIIWSSKTSLGTSILNPFLMWYGYNLWGWKPPD